MDIIKQIFTAEKYILSRPLKVSDDQGDGNGPTEITELMLPFSKLRGRDIVEAQEEYEALEGTLEVFEVEKRFHAYLIAKMANVPYQMILDDLAVNDFTTLTLAVYRFLTRGV